MTVSGGSSNVQHSKMSEKIESKMQSVVGQPKENSFISNESAKALKDKMQEMSKCGTAHKCVDLFENLQKDPVRVVESLRNAEGSDRNEKLLNFQNKIDHMSEKELKMVRNYLVNEMASPKNDDDQLLGALLNAVNKELDSREGGVIPLPPRPFPPFPPGITDGPMPKPTWPLHPGTCNPGGGYPKPMPNFEDVVPLLNKKD